MHLVSRPGNLSLRTQVGRILDSGEKTTVRSGGLLVSIDKSPNGLGHQTRHGLIARCGVNTQLPQQGLRQAQCNVLVRLHVFQFIT